MKKPAQRKSAKAGKRAKRVERAHEPREPRLTVAASAVDPIEPALVESQLVNISRTGALILTDHPLPVGSMVDFRFPILGDVAIMLEGVGEVVRVQDEPAGMGVTFIMLGNSSLKDLNQLLENTR